MASIESNKGSESIFVHEQVPFKYIFLTVVIKCIYFM